ncbi:ATP-binding protein [Aestuariibacter salexigens]|uniref:ATP-binding protein n=1 Tax=Aestuariibacter salexigens TaxID=226010 RepID=UPI0003F86DD9|nr:ATP-binding protein [Aestuariibacter salexigens]
MGLLLLLAMVFAQTAQSQQQHEYGIILVNSFNESDFEARMMYRLMADISSDDRVLVLTVPPFYADSVDALGDEVKQVTLESFRYQLQSIIPENIDASFSRIVAIGRHASVFLNSNTSLLPSTQRYFLHIDWQPTRGTLIPSDYEPTESYRQIMSVFPGTKDIVFIHGSQELELDQGLVENFINKAPEGVKVHYLNPMLRPEQALSELQKMPAQTPIIYINYKSFERNWETVHNWLVTQERFPIFTIFAHNVARYAGGAVVVPEKLADTAVALARGEDFPVNQNPVISLQFNAQQLQKWHLDEDALPADAELVNQHPSVFSRQTVLMIVIFFLAVIFFMAVVMLYRTRRHAAELASAAEVANSANRTKGEFLANMSHEIRTPMNGILGTLQILSRSEQDAQSRDMIKKALLSANSLLTIINDILDYSKIEANKLSLENVSFSVRDVAESVLSDVSLSASSKGLAIHLLIDESFVDGWLGDPVRVRQILLNLMSNAIKFTAHGSVTLSLDAVRERDDCDAIRMSVTDTGIGMDKDTQQRIFARFSQADTSTTRRFGGTGLGMSITTSLVEMMDGTLQLFSEPGQGTTVTITLPLTQATTASEDVQSEHMSAPDMSGKRILIAEDNDINQAIIGSMMEATGATLDFVVNGKQAVEACHQQVYDLVLMDIQMPEMDGTQALSLIKPDHPELPVIALTANVMSEEVASYLQLGFAHHIGKPIDTNILYSTLRQYC